MTKASSSKQSEFTPEQIRNMALAHDVIATVGRPGWADLLAEDVVFEFPYAPSIGFPGRIEGKEAALKYVEGIVQMTGGLNMYDIINMAAAEADLVFNEYKGYYGKSPNNIIPYSALHRYQNGKIILVREYWDPIRVSGKTPEAAAS